MGGNNHQCRWSVLSLWDLAALANEVRSITDQYNLSVGVLHHIGSGSDPQVWLKVALMNFQLVEQFEAVKVLNLGGGYKVGRMPDEVSTDLQVIGEPDEKHSPNLHRELAVRFI